MKADNFYFVFDGVTPASESELITFYESKHYYLSNFSAFQVEYDGRIWMTSEHAYQGMKFDRHDLQERVRECASAHTAMKLARSMKEFYRPNWDEHKVQLMLDVCRAKMAQHAYIRRKLLETGNATLVEASPIDSFWGWGRDKKGRNELGKVWMTLRDELHNQAVPEPTAGTRYAAEIRAECNHMTPEERQEAETRGREIINVAQAQPEAWEEPFIGTGTERMLPGDQYQSLDRWNTLMDETRTFSDITYRRRKQKGGQQ